MPTDTLTPQQLSFVAEYVTNGGNATQAAIAAGYSPTSARHHASRLLKRRNIAQQIASRQGKLAVREDFTIADWRRRVLDDWDSARAAGSWSAAASMQVTMGRHLGALEEQGRMSEFEAAALQWLGSKMTDAVSQSAGETVIQLADSGATEGREQADG